MRTPSVRRKTKQVSLVARYRTVKPETFSDEKLAEVCREARYLFIGLWCFVDDMGRKAYVPKRIQLEVFPADQDLTPKQIDKWARELERVELIKLYKIGRSEYLWIPHFLRHQRIDRPSHSDVPAHPDDPDPSCGCIACLIQDGEINAPRHYHRNRYSELNNPNHPRNVPDFTRGERGDNSATRGALPDRSIRSVVRALNQNQDQTQNQDQPQEQNQPQDQSQLNPDSSAKDRPPRSRELEEIARRMILLLEVKLNSQLLQTLIKSIRTKARSKQCSEEAAAQQIAARAAFVASESPPEDWDQWFADVAYEYVPDGDERLRDRHIEARPICGGPRCSEGWETVKVNNVPVLRRCPDCVKLWSDRGL